VFLDAAGAGDELPITGEPGEVVGVKARAISSIMTKA
jgi:hypothetical protein